MQTLKTGDMVIMHQKCNNWMMIAHRRPDRLKFPHRDELMVVQDNVICSIPDRATALYMGSCSSLLGVFHFVFWNGMPVWASAEDAVLEKIAP